MPTFGVALVRFGGNGRICGGRVRFSTTACASSLPALSNATFGVEFGAKSSSVEAFFSSDVQIRWVLVRFPGFL